MGLIMEEALPKKELVNKAMKNLLDSTTKLLKLIDLNIMPECRHISEAYNDLALAFKIYRETNDEEYMEMFKKLRELQLKYGEPIE